MGNYWLAVFGCLALGMKVGHWLALNHPPGLRTRKEVLARRQRLIDLMMDSADAHERDVLSSREGELDWVLREWDGETSA